jgi:hypothetical protein
MQNIKKCLASYLHSDVCGIVLNYIQWITKIAQIPNDDDVLLPEERELVYQIQFSDNAILQFESPNSDESASIQFECSHGLKAEDFVGSIVSKISFTTNITFDGEKEHHNKCFLESLYNDLCMTNISQEIDYVFGQGVYYVKVTFNTSHGLFALKLRKSKYFTRYSIIIYKTDMLYFYF